MEKLEPKQEKFIKSLVALERSIKVFSRKDTPIDIKESLVASNVKHFEICYESAWKFLQVFLAHKCDKKLDSPKKIFRECFALEIIDDITTKNLLDMSEARNATVHDYDEETAQETCKRILGYYDTLKMLAKIAKES